jgi:hypothetical protein
MSGATNNIRTLRRQQGRSLQWLADRCDPPTTKQTISYLESGAQILTPTWARRIARALGVSPAALLNGEAPAKRGLAEAADVYTSAPADGGNLLARLYPGRGDLQWWRCASTALDRAGILPGDWLVADPGGAPQPNQPVIAQVVDEASGTAEAVLRRWHGTTLDPDSGDPLHAPVPTRPTDGRVVWPILPVLRVLRDY